MEMDRGSCDVFCNIKGNEITVMSNDNYNDYYMLGISIMKLQKMSAYVYADCDLEAFAQSDFFNVEQLEDDVFDLCVLQVVDLPGDRYHLDCIFYSHFVFRRV